jgi:FtsP/CotA-like multicopper oxidase with cupredoxin domain
MKKQLTQKPELEIIQTARYGTMKSLMKYGASASLLAMLMLPVGSAHAVAFTQCPGDTNGDAAIDTVDPQHPNVTCMHLSSGDGYSNMGDGYLQYGFGFGVITDQNATVYNESTGQYEAPDMTGKKVTPLEDSHDEGILNAQFTAPTIVLEQGQEFYLSLSNAGMLERPDLFDPHTVHFHGFPNASSVFDGVPDASISINMGATLTYYYNIVEPGTYLYHCHVEAAEHMQMGMQGNLYVHPAQDKIAVPIVDATAPATDTRTFSKFAYNDMDNYPGQAGSTGYDVEMPLMLTGFDHNFHDAHIAVQPLPFADMKDDYMMFNGRGYPATVEPNGYYKTNPGAAQARIGERIRDVVNTHAIDAGYKQSYDSQPYTSKMEVTQGQKILLRITNLSITQFHTITALGIPMKVIGQGGRELQDKYYANSVNLGGGESFDVILDTQNVAAGTYYVFTNELQLLSNNQQSFGGAMTEIVVSAAN